MQPGLGEIMKAEIGLRHSFFCDGVSFKQFSPGYKYALPPPCSHLIPPPLIFLYLLSFLCFLQTLPFQSFVWALSTYFLDSCLSILCKTSWPISSIPLIYPFYLALTTIVKFFHHYISHFTLVTIFFKKFKIFTIISCRY